MVTELCLAEDEFQTVAVTPGSRITFCLKEFRVSPCLGPPPQPRVTPQPPSTSSLSPGPADLRRGLQLAPHHPLRRARQVGVGTLTPLC